MLHVDGLTFGYRKQQPDIEAVNLEVKAGDILGLLGPNGAGKTTLVSLIIGLLTPQAGRVVLEGLPVVLGDRRIGLVPQEYAFYPRLTARENLAYFAGIQGLSGAAARDAIDRALAACDLADCQHQRAGHYSGGLKRRLNFAIALLTQPQLLILDEPTANVDPQTRKLLLDNIRTLNRQGVAIIYTSHLLAEVESLCQHVALLHRGRLILSGRMEALLREEHQRVDIKCPEAPPPALQQQLQARVLEGDWWQFSIGAGQSPASVLAALEAAHCHYSQVRYGSQRLEDVYLAALSGKETVS